MATRRCFIGLAIAGIFVIGIWLVGSVSQGMAETLNFRAFSQVTKREALPLPDAEGHSVGLTILEGVWISENGEFAWVEPSTFGTCLKE